MVNFYFTKSISPRSPESLPGAQRPGGLRLSVRRTSVSWPRPCRSTGICSPVFPPLHWPLASRRRGTVSVVLSKYVPEYGNMKFSSRSITATTENYEIDLSGLEVSWNSFWWTRAIRKQLVGAGTQLCARRKFGNTGAKKSERCFPLTGGLSSEQGFHPSLGTFYTLFTCFDKVLFNSCFSDGHIFQ